MGWLCAKCHTFISFSTALGLYKFPHFFLTLRLEEQLIDNAKRFAKQSGKSLSQMVADYFTLLEKHTLTNDKELPTVTASLKGVLQVEPFQGLDEIDYRTYLESKYL